MGIELTMKSKAAAVSTCFANVASSHMACPPVFIKTILQYADHEIGVAATSPETVSDQNDYYQVAAFF